MAPEILRSTMQWHGDCCFTVAWQVQYVHFVIHTAGLCGQTGCPYAIRALQTVIFLKAETVHHLLCILIVALVVVLAAMYVTIHTFTDHCTPLCIFVGPVRRA